ncbi:MAG: primase [Solirubrobacteraceae bacterium]|jgi:DNA primase|nr:primase [Solirubrobacteraceae bacterium]
MPKFTRSSVDAVRDAIDMVDLVSARTELRKAGARSYTGICPFHEERSPSFSVEPIDKLYHCFGCQAGGDAFSFVQEIEGVGFSEAVELLAQRYGVQLELEAEDPRDAERRLARERLLELLERTAAYYVRYLWESHEARHAREYLLGRGMEEATLREFRVGYAPSAWDKILLASRQAGFGNREIYDAGLATKNDSGRIYDRFRGRITFPLCDSRGRVLGFGARAMGDARGAKYINTPETDIFRKARVLFGADHARASAARAGRVVAVEGYTDVLALHQAGLRNCVGIMGTALTEEQVAEVSRLAPTVLLALDSDSAGHEAMLRAARVAEGRKLELRVVALPQGSDPADMVAEPGGPARLTELVEGSIPFVRFRVERALATGDVRGAEGKDSVIAELRPVFATIPPSVLREELLALVADRLSVSSELLVSLLSRGGRLATPTGGSSSEPSRAANRLSPEEQVEREFLAYCVAFPDLGGPVLAELDIERELNVPAMQSAAAWLRDHLTALDGEIDDPDVASLLTALKVRAQAPEITRGGFEVQRLQLALRRVRRDISAAPAGAKTALAKRREELQKAFDDAQLMLLEQDRSGAE